MAPTSYIKKKWDRLGKALGVDNSDEFKRKRDGGSKNGAANTTSPVPSAAPSPDAKVHRHEQALPSTKDPLLPGHGPATPIATPPIPPAPSVSENQPAILNKPSHTSSVEERHYAHYEAEGDKPELSSTSKVSFQGGLGLTSAASTENREQSEHHRDGLPTSDGQKPPNNGRSRAKSLWGQAYTKLDKKLVDDYENLLRNELPTRGCNISPSDAQGQSDDSPGDAANQLSADPTVLQAQLDKIIKDAQTRMDEVVNQIPTDPTTGKAMLEDIAEHGQQRKDKKKIRFHIGSHPFIVDVEGLVAQAADFVLWGKDLVDQAIKPSAEASLIWAGVCLILPLLTYPYLASQANESGFNYVTARMNFYVALEPRLLPATEDISEERKDGVQRDLIDLYQHILEFQLKSVLRFYNSAVKRMAKDVRSQGIWKKMLSDVKEAEETLDRNFKITNIVDIKDALNTANQSFRKLCEFLPVAEELLEINKRQAAIQEKQLQENERTNEILGAIKLPTVQVARYNSADVQDNPNNPKCQKGTRIGILSWITAWATDPTSEPLFWLFGPAGTGKSTIARTLRDTLKDEAPVAAGYFFKRGDKVRNATARFFPTIAEQLAETIPSFKAELRKSLEGRENDVIESMALKDQFQILLRGPLSQLRPDGDILTWVVVIDALDECERPEHICEILLSSQLQQLDNVRLRVLLTSRSASPIVTAFKEFEKRSTYCSLSLQEEFYEETKADITAFLKVSFANLKKKRKISKRLWPDPEDLDRVVRLATTPKPLFLYAATICRVVERGKEGTSPVDRLKRWLDKSGGYASQQDDQLTEMYETALDEVWSHSDLNDNEKELLGEILRSIILLATPLPPRCLAELLRKEVDVVNYLLPYLHAVLDIPEKPDSPVEIVHKSFSDFLLGHEGTGKTRFRVDAVATHAMLTSKCIDRMDRKDDGLQYDMCKLRDPGKLRDDIDEGIIAGRIPLDLEYACLSWAYHMQRGGQGIAHEDETYKFLQKHFLHWLESLSLLSKLSAGITSVRQVIQSSTSPELVRFLKDGERFGASFMSIMERAPLQTYGAALVFCPAQSEVKKLFWGQQLPFIENVTGIKKDWDLYRQTLTGHRDTVRSVAFSSDGTMLASASDDRTVRLWAIDKANATAEFKQELTGHRDWVCSVAFSSDGTMLASASDDTTVRLWAIDKANATAEFKQELTGHWDSVRSVAFSSDGTMLASASDDRTVRLWAIDKANATAEFKQELTGHRDSVRSVAFSSDGTMLASASADTTVRLWAIDKANATGEFKQELTGHRGWVHSVAFSSDGTMLASASADTTVRLWAIDKANATGEFKQELTGHRRWVHSVAFSSDGTMLASASADTTVRLWAIDKANATAEFKQELTGHRGSVRSVAFSSDGTMLASASDDTTVRLWAIDKANATAEFKQELTGHRGWVRSVAFSSDGTMLASASADRTVRLWAIDKANATGEFKQELTGHRRWVHSVAFSSDGTMLASASADTTVRLWAIDKANATAEFKQELTGHRDSVHSVAFSSDGTMLASASADTTVRLWAIDKANATAEFKQELTGHRDWVRSVAFSSDGTMLASASDDTTVRLWAIDKANATGEFKQELTGHRDSVRSVAFSSDGTMLASASADTTVRLWAIDKANATAEFKQECSLANTRLIERLSFSEDGRYLQTDRGLLNLSKPETSIQDSTRVVFVNENRIIRDGQDLLWLPPDYEATCSAFSNEILVLGHKSGLVTFFTLKS